MHVRPARVRSVLAVAAAASVVVALTLTWAPPSSASAFAGAAVGPSTVPPVTPSLQTVDFTGRVSAKSTAAAASATTSSTRSAAGASTGRTSVAPYGLVAASWASDPAVTGVVVQVRSRTAGRWSAWEPLAAADDENLSPGSTQTAPRTGTDPLWVGAGADGVEARLTSSTGAAPQGLQVDLIDPGASATTSARPATTSSSTTSAVAAAASVAGPTGVVTRAQWGADESVRTRCAPGGPDYTGTPKAAVIHHTAGSNDYGPGDSAAIVRGIYAYHGVTLGWCDIGYNFVVDKYGQIFEGRAGGMDKPVFGAHAGGFNEFTFGVAVLGDYTQVPAGSTAIEALSKVIAYKFALGGTNPYGTATLTSAGGGTSKFTRGTVVTKPAIMGHMDLGSTACPGDFENKLGQIRDRVAQLMPQQPNALLWQMRNAAGPGFPDTTTVYGGVSTRPLACDVNGDGRDDVAVYDKGHWLIRTTFGGGPSDYSFDYGWTTGTAVCGDWDGDGKDGIGVSENGAWYLKNTAGPGQADQIISYGFDGAVPLAGDWDLDGRDTIGVYAPNDVYWMLRNSNSPGVADTVFNYGWRTGTPVVGDWNGDGRTDIGMFENGAWWLRNSPTPGPADRVFSYGDKGYIPVVANVDGTPGDGVGVVTKVRY